jgi:lysyl-tRNA synthetase class 2
MSDQEEHALIARRREKLNALREAGRAFPNDFRRDAIAGELHAEYGDRDNEVLEASPVRVKVAGRLMAKRVMGKASFAQLQDMSGRIQLFLQRDGLEDGVYQAFKGWDIGDIIGAEGVMFKTKTGELSVGNTLPPALCRSHYERGVAQYLPDAQPHRAVHPRVPE